MEDTTKSVIREWLFVDTFILVLPLEMSEKYIYKEIDFDLDNLSEGFLFFPNSLA